MKIKQAIIGNNFKLLANSAYGKTIENKENQKNITYTKSKKVIDNAMGSAFFNDLTEIGSTCELESRKKRIKLDRPFQIGIAVYQLAKLRILQFYYDFIDKYIDRKDFELILMDTDSLYMALSAKNLEDVVRPNLLKEFHEEKNKWLAWDKWSNRTPGLFKKSLKETE